MKECRTCGQVKPESDFYVRRKNIYGDVKLCNDCKACTLAYRRNHKHKRKPLTRLSRLIKAAAAYDAYHRAGGACKVIIDARRDPLIDPRRSLIHDSRFLRKMGLSCDMVDGQGRKTK